MAVCCCCFCYALCTDCTIAVIGLSLWHMCLDLAAANFASGDSLVIAAVVANQLFSS